jgi:hypothetical protein
VGEAGEDSGTGAHPTLIQANIQACHLMLTVFINRLNKRAHRIPYSPGSSLAQIGIIDDGLTLSSTRRVFKTTYIASSIPLKIDYNMK